MGDKKDWEKKDLRYFNGIVKATEINCCHYCEDSVLGLTVILTENENGYGGYLCCWDCLSDRKEILSDKDRLKIAIKTGRKL